MTSRSLLLFVSMILVGCGGKSLDNSDGGSDSGGSDSPQPGPDCPASAPNQGTSCSIEGLECEYGSDVRSTCNALVMCSKGSWDVRFGNDPSCPTKANAPTCPSSPSQATGSCSDMGLACNYSTSNETQFCVCSYMGGPPMMDGGITPYWQCSFGTSTGCPAVRPKIGATCSQPNLDCSYDVCGAPEGLSFQCNSATNTWTEGFGDVCAGAGSK
jgi:hypothetical protein